jgi:hypothetical protein
MEPPLPYWFYNLGITLAFGNSAVNPFLYGFGNRSVRKAWISFIRSNVSRLYVCGRLRRHARNSSCRLFVAPTNATSTAPVALNIPGPCVDKVPRL